MLRGILFDFNGVLVDDEPLHLELFQAVLAEEGIALSRDDYWSWYLGFDDRGVFRTVLERTGETPTADRLSRLLTRKASYYQTRVHRDGFPIFAGAARLVEELADAGLELGVVSGALREEIEGALKQMGLRRRFKVVVAAEDVREGKPSPEGYRRGLDLLNSQPPLPTRLLHPHEVLAIEDSPAGIEAAAGASLSTLAVAHTYPASALAAADACVPALAGLDVDRLRRLFAGRA